MHKPPLSLHPFGFFTVDCKRLSRFRKIDSCHLNNLILTNLLAPKQNHLRHSKIINIENSLRRGSVYLPAHIFHLEEVSGL